VHPEYRRVVATYLSRTGIEIEEVPLQGGLTDAAALASAAEGAAGVAVQSPNFLGCIEDAKALAAGAHEAGALFVSVCDPISLGVLEAPGVLGADVAVGEGQGLGCPPAFGGPHFGFLAARQKHVRLLPGRVVGATADDRDRRGYVLTFQTREQHIRREKATSNICTNQGLMALRAAVYLALLGPEGLRETAEACARNAHAAAEALASVKGFSLLHDAPFFKEFALRCPVPASEVVEALVPDGFLAGVPLEALGEGPENVLLVAATETRTQEEIAALAGALSRRFA
jgi:glycine dehydrogenase subunit 1